MPRSARPGCCSADPAFPLGYRGCDGFDGSSAGSTVHLGPRAAEPHPEPTPSAPPDRKREVVGEIPREPPAFQRREGLPRRLAELAGSGRVAVVCALTGARGVGKTQLAAAYARARIADGWPVAWIPAEQPGQLRAGRSSRKYARHAPGERAVCLGDDPTFHRGAERRSGRTWSAQCPGRSAADASHTARGSNTAAGWVPLRPFGALF